MALTLTMLFGGPRTVRILSDRRKWMKDAYLLGCVGVKSAEAFRMGIRNPAADWSARMVVGFASAPTEGSTPLTVNIQNPVPDMPDYPYVSRFEFLDSWSVYYQDSSSWICDIGLFVWYMQG
jgi:hypothetical protein